VKIGRQRRGRRHADLFWRWLLSGFAVLLSSCFPDLPASSVQRMDAAAATGITARMKIAAELLAAHLGVDADVQLQQHEAIPFVALVPT
jgi:hypothetical protein